MSETQSYKTVTYNVVCDQTAETASSGYRSERGAKARAKYLAKFHKGEKTFSVEVSGAWVAA